MDCTRRDVDRRCTRAGRVSESWHTSRHACCDDVPEMEAMDGTRNALTSAAERRSVTKLRVVIADDHMTFFEGFRMPLARDAVGTVIDGCASPAVTGLTRAVSGDTWSRFRRPASQDAAGSRGMMTPPPADRGQRTAA